MWLPLRLNGRFVLNVIFCIKQFQKLFQLIAETTHKAISLSYILYRRWMLILRLERYIVCFEIDFIHGLSLPIKFQWIGDWDEANGFEILPSPRTKQNAATTQLRNGLTTIYLMDRQSERPLCCLLFFIDVRCSLLEVWMRKYNTSNRFQVGGNKNDAEM